MEAAGAATGKTQRRPTARDTKLLIGGLVALAAVVYLILSAMRGSAAFYLTVEELLAEGPSERTVRVAGAIAEHSILWRVRDMVLEFEIGDQSGRLPVEYHGSRPDMFRDGAEIVAEGQYTARGIFEAQTLLLKCPSKYEVASAAD
jgi:cytochrome c-type biogenesis protein CcmE